jgi:hypothetical protein
LLRARVVQRGKLQTEHLEATEEGRKAVVQWIKNIRPSHVLPDDPLRTKLQSFDLLTREERLEWIAEIKTELSKKLDAVDLYGEEESVPFHALVHDNAVRALRMRMDWLDRVLCQVIRDRD